jgi:hypothetical protein
LCTRPFFRDQPCYLLPWEMYGREGFTHTPDKLALLPPSIGSQVTGALPNRGYTGIQDHRVLYKKGVDWVRRSQGFSTKGGNTGSKGHIAI